MSGAEGRGGPRDEQGGSPFDESFVSGARYHEPSARERARWVKQAQKTKRRNARAKREAELRGLGERLLPWGLLAAVTLVYWLAGR